MIKTKTFYVVDCSYYFRASYFALPPIFSPSGKLVNAVYGFAATLIKLIRRHPSALVIADDTHGHYFRHELLRSYKSGKKSVPGECDQQMPFLHQLLNAMTIPYLSVEGFEADDIIATLSVEARHNGYFTYICSRDKDLQQLLADDVAILNVSSGEETTGTVLKERLGILPSQIPDMIALTGDKVDSIPGIPGIGLKTAAKLLNIHGDLESLMQHTEALNSKLRNSVRECREQALLSKKLASLRTDVNIGVPFSAFAFRSPDTATIEPVLRELGLGALLKRFDNALSGVAGD